MSVIASGLSNSPAKLKFPPTAVNIAKESEVQLRPKSVNIQLPSGGTPKDRHQT